MNIRYEPPNGFYREANDIVEKLNVCQSDAERKILLFKELERLFSEANLQIAKQFLYPSFRRDSE